MGDSSGRKALVIGAGLGGIGAAVSLAARGWSVDVFEKNEHVGGKLNLLKLDGFSFDLGPSILTLPHIFQNLFAKVGKRFEDYVKIRSITPHWRNFFEDGTKIDLYPSASETARMNKGLTALDERDLENFLAYSKRLYERCEESYFERGLENVWQMIAHHGMLAALFKFEVFRSMEGGVASHIRNPHLRDIMGFFVKYVGSSATDAPGVLNLLPHVQSEFGLWYVDGGLYNLALGLRRLMEETGIRIHLEAEVAEVLSDQGRVQGLRLTDGSIHQADVVVCNMEVVPAHQRLLGESPSELKRFQKFEPSCSGLVLHLGVDRTYPHLAHHNFLFSANQKKHFNSVFRDKTLPEDPTIYLVAAARTDPSQAPEGCENLKILPHIPHIQDQPFSAAEYDALTERVLDKLERMGLENLRRHVICEHRWVPEDIEKLYYSNRGSIYGVVSDRWKNLGFKAPRQSDRFANLWFVGGSVNPGGGMPMALLSGQLAVDRILASTPEN